VDEVSPSPYADAKPMPKRIKVPTLAPASAHPTGLGERGTKTLASSASVMIATGQGANDQLMRHRLKRSSAAKVTIASTPHTIAHASSLPPSRFRWTAPLAVSADSA